MPVIGDLNEKSEEIRFEWKIKDFFSLSDEIDAFYLSPTFYFSGASWVIQISPNLERDNPSSGGWIDLYVNRMSTGLPISVTFSLDLKTADGKTHSGITATRMFAGIRSGWGCAKTISRENLKEKKSDLAPLDILTIICTLKRCEFQAMDCSLFSRQQEICENLKEIYEKAKKTDFTLQVKGTSIPAHRIILETRSPVFAAMLNHDTKENRTGVVSIDDLEVSAVKSILQYMYCGDIEKITNEDVFSIYAAADKYDVKNIKEICLEYIKMNLTEEWVCDVIEFADLYKEEEIGRCAREFFRKNARKILQTEKWKTFAKENHDAGIELLGSLVEALLPE